MQTSLRPSQSESPFTYSEINRIPEAPTFGNRVQSNSNEIITWSERMTGPYQF